MNRPLALTAGLILLGAAACSTRTELLGTVDGESSAGTGGTSADGGGGSSGTAGSSGAGGAAGAAGAGFAGQGGGPDVLDFRQPVALGHDCDGYSYEVRVADVNARVDSSPDIVLATDDCLIVWKGVGDGSFDAAYRVTDMGFGTALALGDVSFDGDSSGMVDAVGADGQLTLFGGSGWGTLEPVHEATALASRHPGALHAIQYEANPGPNEIAIGMTDGWLKVYVFDGTVLVNRFAEQLPAGIDTLAVADFNGVNRPDFVAASGGRLYTLLDQLPFGEIPAADALGPLRFVTAGKLDGDDCPDLVAMNAVADGNPGGTTQLHVLLNTCDGTAGFTFGSTVALSEGTFARIADVDRDGNQDVVVAEASPTNGVAIFRGNGDGSLRAPERFPAGQNPQTLDVADLDGDGAPDIVVSNSGLGAGGVSVLLAE